MYKFYQISRFYTVKNVFKKKIHVGANWTKEKHN